MFRISNAIINPDLYKDILLSFYKDYPKVVKESDINDILKSLKAKQKNK